VLVAVEDLDHAEAGRLAGVLLQRLVVEGVSAIAIANRTRSATSEPVSASRSFLRARETRTVKVSGVQPARRPASAWSRPSTATSTIASRSLSVRRAKARPMMGGSLGGSTAVSRGVDAISFSISR
jgi:hypothetical protein